MIAEVEPRTFSQHILSLMERLGDAERRIGILEERLNRVRSAAAIEIACEKAERAPEVLHDHDDVVKELG